MAPALLCVVFLSVLGEMLLEIFVLTVTRFLPACVCFRLCWSTLVLVLLWFPAVVCTATTFEPRHLLVPTCRLKLSIRHSVVTSRTVSQKARPTRKKLSISSILSLLQAPRAALSPRPLPLFTNTIHEAHHIPRHHQQSTRQLIGAPRNAPRVLWILYNSLRRNPSRRMPCGTGTAALQQRRAA